MSILDELGKRFRITEEDSPTETKHLGAKGQVVVVDKVNSAVGGAASGFSTNAFPVKCKICREIMTLTPNIPEFMCRCGILWTLPQN